METIMEAHDGFLNAELLLATAESDPSLELHKGFNWNDTEAAHQHRLSQARLMMRSIRFEVIVEEAEEEEVTLKRLIWSAGRAEQRYGRFDVVAGDAALYQQALEEAIRLLRGVRDRHRELVELEHIWQSIDAL